MVYIKRLTIQGFKSFGPRRTSINLDRGLIVVTGPNGGGKSNIMDAVRFALGELSAHNLRVGRMAELIHDEPGTSYAKVSITFDNSEEVIPVDSQEVTISRRMDKDGESTYFLNGRQVSRNELLTLLSLANIKPSGFNIVPQGSVIEIAEMSGAELRKLIEDISGISDYEKRRDEAEKQLSIAEKNIAVAKASTGEVRKRVKQLERERNQAYRRNHVEKLLNTIKSLELRRNIGIIESEIRSIDRELTRLEDELNELNSTRSHLSEKKKLVEDRWEECAKKLRIIEEEMGKIRDYRATVSEEINKLNVSVSVMRERVERLSDERVYIEEKIKEIRDRIREIEKEIKKSENSLRVVTSEYNEKERIVGEVEEKLRWLQKEYREKSLSLNNKKKEAESALRRLEAEAARVDTKIVQLSKFYENSREEAEKLMEDSVEKVAELLEKSNRLSAILEEEKHVEARLLKLRDELESRLEGLNSMKKFESRLYNILKKVAASGLVRKPGEREKILEVLNSAGIKGVYGFLDSQIEANEKNLKILEAATDGWIHSLIVDNWRLGLKLADTLADAGITLRILPLDVARSLGDSGRLRISNISFRSKTARDCLRYLLRRTRVVLRAGSPRFGEKVVSPKLVIHEDLRIETNPLNRAFLENILTREYEKASDVLETLRENMRREEDDVKGLEDDIRRIEGDLMNLKVEKDGILREGWAMYVSVSENIVKEIDLWRRLKDVEVELEQARNKREAIKRSLEELKFEELERGEIELNRLEDAVDSLRRTYEKLRFKVVEVGSRVKDLEGRTRKLEEERLRLKEEEENLQRRFSRLRFEEEEALKKREENLRRLEEARKRLQENTEKLEELSELKKKLSEEVDRYTSELRKYISRIEEIEGNYQEASSKATSLKIRRAQLEAELNRLKEMLKELGEGEIDLPEFSEELLRELEKDLEEELKELEMINQLAPAQYEELVKHYKLRSSRISELEEERDQILKFIEWVEGEKRRIFLKTFEKVAEAFEIFFNRLTGGEGWIRLENPEDPFSGGIEMILRFPGKPARNVRAASGGEKSVAAVALLLALQGLTPADFYIFDEVDAHMDLQYSKRLAGLFKEMAGRTQIIVISLKDVMAEKADQLIGVYNRGGESRVVRTRLSEVVEVGR